ncbi:hypothetical protein FWH30_00430 [Microgenomates group bacterium]|nr:hypothetical protein [Microgenomates group bacterium]
MKNVHYRYQRVIHGMGIRGVNWERKRWEKDGEMLERGGGGVKERAIFTENIHRIAPLNSLGGEGSLQTERGLIFTKIDLPTTAITSFYNIILEEKV